MYYYACVGLLHVLYKRLKIRFTSYVMCAMCAADKSDGAQQPANVRRSEEQTVGGRRGPAAPAADSVDQGA